MPPVGRRPGEEDHEHQRRASASASRRSRARVRDGHRLGRRAAPPGRDHAGERPEDDREERPEEHHRDRVRSAPSRRLSRPAAGSRTRSRGCRARAASGRGRTARHFDLSRPNCFFSACRVSGVACGTRERFETALPGASRKRAKLIVIATKTVTTANGEALDDVVGASHAGGASARLVHVRQAQLRERVERRPAATRRTPSSSSTRRRRDRALASRCRAASVQGLSASARRPARRFAWSSVELLLRVHRVVASCCRSRSRSSRRTGRT